MATDWNAWFGHEHPPALSKVWVLESTWTDMSVELQKLIQVIWRNYELGNDSYIFKTSIGDLREMADGFKGKVWYWGKTPEEQKGWVEENIDLTPLIIYLEEKGVEENDRVFLHHWW